MQHVTTLPRSPSSFALLSFLLHVVVSDCDAKCGDVGGTFSEHIGLCECHGMQVTRVLGLKVMVVTQALLIISTKNLRQVTSTAML